MATFLDSVIARAPAAQPAPETAAQPQGSFLDRVTSGQVTPENFHPTSFAPTKMEGGPDNAFTKGVARGTAQIGGLVSEAQSFLGGVLDNEWLKTQGEDGIRSAMLDAMKNPAEVGTMENIEGLADVGTWVAEKLGEQAPMLAGIAGASLLTGGGAAAATIPALGRAAIGKAFLRGALAGSGAASATLGVGEVSQELREFGVNPEDYPGLVFGAGGAIGLLDVAGIAGMYKAAFPGVAPKIAETFTKQIARSFGLGLTKGALAEAPTEATQELIAIAAKKYVDPTYRVLTPENLKRMAEAGAVGGLVGGAIGGVGGVVSGVAESVERAGRLAAGANIINSGIQAARSMISAGAVRTENEDGTPVEGTPVEGGPQQFASGLFDTTKIRETVTGALDQVQSFVETARNAAKAGLDVNTVEGARTAAREAAGRARDWVTAQIAEQSEVLGPRLEQGFARVREALAEIDRRISETPRAQPSGKVAKTVAETTKKINTIIEELNTTAREKLNSQAYHRKFAEALEMATRLSEQAQGTVGKTALQRLRKALSRAQTLSEQSYKKARKELDTGLNAALARLNKVAEPKDPRQGELFEPAPVADPISDITAQLAALKRGVRRAVVAKGARAERALRRQVEARQLDMFETPDGPIAVRKADRAEVERAYREQGIGAALGFGSIPVNGPAIVEQETDAQGGVVREEIRPLENYVEEAAAPAAATPAAPARPRPAPREVPKSESAARPQASVAVKTAEQIVKERVDRLVEEAELDPKDSPELIAQAVRNIRALVERHGALDIPGTAEIFEGFTWNDFRARFSAPLADFIVDEIETIEEEYLVDIFNGDIDEVSAAPYFYWSLASTKLMITETVKDISGNERLPLKRRGYKTREGAERGLAKLQAQRPDSILSVESLGGAWVIKEEVDTYDKRTILYMEERIVDRAKRLSTIGKSANKIIMGTRPGEKSSTVKLYAPLITALGRLMNVGTNRDATEVALNVRNDFLTGVAVLQERGWTIRPGPNVDIGGMTLEEARGLSIKLDDLVKEYNDRGTTSARKQEIRAEVEKLGFPAKEGLDDEAFSNMQKAKYRQEEGLTDEEGFDEEDYSEGVRGLRMAVEQARERQEANEALKAESELDSGPGMTPMRMMLTGAPRGDGPTPQVVNLTDIEGTEALSEILDDTLGIKQEVLIFDESSAPGLIYALRRSGRKAMAVAVEEAVASDKQGRFIPFRERALIFVSENAVSGREYVLGHELGHLVEYVVLNQAPKSVQKEVLDALGNKKTEKAREAFANRIAEWMSRPEQSTSNEVDGLLRKIATQLRKLFERLKRAFPQRNETFEAFMEAVTGAVAHRRGGPERAFSSPLAVKYFNALKGTSRQYLPYSTDGVYTADFTLPQVPQGLTVGYINRFSSFAKRMANNPRETVKQLFWTADAELRSYGDVGANIAKEFHIRPGEQGPEAVFSEINRVSGRFFSKLAPILEAIPKSSPVGFWRRRQPTAETEAIQRALIEQLPLDQIADPTTREHVQAVRTYLREVYDWFKGQGLGIGFKRDYFPLQLDPAYVERNKNQFINTLVRHKVKRSDAAKLYSAVVNDPSGGLLLHFGNNNPSEFFGPADPFQLKRDIFNDERLRRDMYEFFEKDVANVTIKYTEFMVRRAVWSKRFRKPPNAPAKPYLDAGIKPQDPVAHLKLRLKDALRTGALTQAQHDRIVQQILPAYAGRLGVDMNPKLREMTGYMLVYQNLRLLSLSLLSQFVDLGTLLNHAGWETHGLRIRSFIRASRTQEAKEMARTLGIVRDGLTDHILNDRILNTYVNTRAQKMNDLFFRFNGMEGWTNLMRTMGMLMGREFLKNNAVKAEAGDAKAVRKLAELGVTWQDLTGWDGSVGGNAKIDAALHRFVDQGMIRPTPAIRPVFMSDPHYALFVHLKPFLYGFWETFMRATYNQAKIDRSLLPFVLMAGFVLPFAAVGYELRRFITGAEAPDGFAYARELFERGGLLGPFQLVADMEQGRDFGKPFAIAAGGPAIEQIYDIATKDMQYWLPRAVPIVATIPAARDLIRESID